MPDGTQQLGLTFVLASLSATVFLHLRCQGTGRLFGPASRWVALAVIALTGVVSSLVGLAVSGVEQYLQVLVGAVAPSGLWLSYMRRDENRRRSFAEEIATFWLVSLLERLHQAMAEDRMLWCEKRVDPNWSVHDLTMAAGYYHELMTQRLAADERRRERIHARLHAIERRLDVAALIEDGASRSKIVAALGGSRDTKKVRYERYLTDFAKLHGVLCNDAEQELKRLLDSAYRCGLRSLEPYRRVVRDARPTGIHP